MQASPSTAAERFAAALPTGVPVTSTSRLLRKVGAEMIGTFALVFAGCGAIMADQITGGAVSHVGVGLTFGLVIMVMIYATGHVSGAHFNPAVTIAFASIGRFPWKQVPAYVIGQITAAVLASLCLYTLLGPIADLGATAPAGPATQALVLEVIVTFFLMFVITSVATDSRAVGQMAGWAIGGTVALAAIFAGPISGASMNPARSLGPALVAGQLAHGWLYVAAPIMGALLGAWAYKLVRCGGEEQTAGGCC
jgi:MIP family channel proteins